MSTKKCLLGMTLEELKVLTSELAFPQYTAKQLADWLYKKKVNAVSDMTNLSLANRRILDELFEVGVRKPIHSMKSKDGTIKYLFEAGGHHSVEAVYIPTIDRSTLCVSSQIGCKMNCSFCMTGKQGFYGDLTANEILNQVRSIPESDALTNIVFMGMGEPLDNIEPLFKVLDILTASYGYGWSPKRITVSTIGLVKGLERFLNESDCHLAISLHSPFPDERLGLMPIEKTSPSHQLISMLRQYDFTHQRRVSFEYIVFKGLNDSMRHADALVSLLEDIPCRVNLIRFHTIPSVKLESPDVPQMEKFRDRLNVKGTICTIRASRGEDICAACGMLSTAKSRMK